DELPEELEHPLEVSDLDGDVIDADEHGHVLTQRLRYAGDSAQTPASSTMVAAAAAMSWTLAHSRTEWYSCPPVNRFGVGSPCAERTAPSVPPRVIASFGSKIGRA